MTTAYTPILQLALPVTGELDGTWGTVVNDNITSMIEQAIAGLATINTWTTASHTLTTADGTTDEARCAVLECSGAPGAAATVICPARTKLFVIKNSVTGGYAVTLKTSAGTGISVPNGSTALLYCDGTNVVSGATYMATLVTTSITDSGLTAGRVTYAGTGGLLQDAAALTFDGTTLSSTKFAGALDGTVGATTPTTVVATQVDITAQGDLRLQDTTGGQYVALQAPGTVAASYTLTLPVDDGTAGQALVTDGSGVLSWSTAASGDVYGPASATDNAVARFDGTTGKIIQNSVVTIADTTGNMAGVGTLGVGAITASANAIISDNSANAALRITQVGAGNALLVEDSANPDTTPFVVTNNGSVGIGTQTPQSLFDVSVDGDLLPLFRAYGASVSNYPAIVRGRGTQASPAAVQNLDSIGGLIFLGYDGTSNVIAALIRSDINGTPGTNDMPGRLVFATTADGDSLVTERMTIDSAGIVEIGGSTSPNSRLSIGSGSSSGASLSLGRNVTGGAVAWNTYTFGTVQSDVTSQAKIYVSYPSTAAAAFTLPSLTGFSAQQNVIGAGSAITNQFGFVAESNLTGATNNYGFYGAIAVGTGRFNFYSAGTAANVFVGTTSIGGIVGAESLRATPVASAVNYLNVIGAITTASPAIQAAGSDTNIDVTLTPKGTGVLRYGTLTANADAPITGYITIKDSGGTTRKLAVIA
jgi:hypothetical protein